MTEHNLSGINKSLYRNGPHNVSLFKSIYIDIYKYIEIYKTLLDSTNFANN